MFSHDDVEYIAPQQRQFGADTTVASTGFFSSPSDLYNAAQQTNAAFTEMFNSVNANRSSAHPTIPTSVRDEFVPFAIGWNAFFQQNFSNIVLVTARWLTSDLQAHLIDYQQKIAAWGAKLKKYKVDVDSAVSLKPGSQGGAKNVMMWVGIGAVALVGLFIVGKLVHTVALGSAALTEAEDEAMKIAEEKAAQKRNKKHKTILSIT